MARQLLPSARRTNAPIRLARWPGEGGAESRRCVRSARRTFPNGAQRLHWRRWAPPRPLRRGPGPTLPRCKIKYFSYSPTPPCRHNSERPPLMGSNGRAKSLCAIDVCGWRSIFFGFGQEFFRRLFADLRFRQFPVRSQRRVAFAADHKFLIEILSKRYYMLHCSIVRRRDICIFRCLRL